MFSNRLSPDGRRSYTRVIPMGPSTTLLICVATDSTDYRWSRIVTTLCNPGDAYITEERTYPPTLVASAPHGIHSVGVLMDDRGMRSDELRKLLEGWDETTRGSKRYVSTTHPYFIRILSGLSDHTSCTQFQSDKILQAW